MNRYNGHYFVTTLIYSILLGVIGVDRFCLGHTGDSLTHLSINMFILCLNIVLVFLGTAVGKLLTLGGVGVWWMVDIILLVTGHLLPADESNWVPYY